MIDPVAFDDIIKNAGSVSTVWTRARQLVRERAEHDAPDEYCAACVDETPLAYSWAQDISTITFVDKLILAATLRLEALDGRTAEDLDPSDPDLSLHDRWAVRSELQDEYVEAYFDACPAPEECEVCTNPDEYGACGHIQWGDGECPA